MLRLQKGNWNSNLILWPLQSFRKNLRNYYEHVNLKNIKHRGFIADRSTVTNLSSCLFPRQLNVDIIYTEFSKAFGKFNHYILLLKIETVGIDSSLSATYRAYVKHLWYKLHNFLQTSGIPQGSVLGTLVFKLSISNMVSNIDVQHLGYADNMKLYYELTSVLIAIMYNSTSHPQIPVDTKSNYR